MVVHGVRRPMRDHEVYENMSNVTTSSGRKIEKTFLAAFPMFLTRLHSPFSPPQPPVPCIISELRLQSCPFLSSFLPLLRFERIHDLTCAEFRLCSSGSCRGPEPDGEGEGGEGGGREEDVEWEREDGGAEEGTGSVAVMPECTLDGE